MFDLGNFTKQTFNEKLEVFDGIQWGSLKYGLCSYFALAYQEIFPDFNEFFVVREYDEDLEKHYLVHVLAKRGDLLVDAEGSYSVDEWELSTKEIVDIEHMQLDTIILKKADIVSLIEEDFGWFNTEFYDEIKSFVSEVYNELEHEKSIFVITGTGAPSHEDVIKQLIESEDELQNIDVSNGRRTTIENTGITCVEEIYLIEYEEPFMRAIWHEKVQAKSIEEAKEKFWKENKSSIIRSINGDYYPNKLRPPDKK